LLAIKEFNDNNEDIKIGKSLTDASDFRFPLGNDKLFMMHNFNHTDYLKNLNYVKSDLSLNDNKSDDIFKLD